MLIETYDLEVFTPPYEPGAERFAAKDHLKVDISEVLPISTPPCAAAAFTPTKLTCVFGKATALAHSTIAPPWVSGAYRINELGD